jgi:DNA end-binding protein Ku
MVDVRPFWSGVLTFGLVSVPVELYAAVGRSRVALHLLSPDGHPLKRRYVSSEDQAPLAPERIVRGWPTAAGQFVTVTQEELDALAPERSREIDLRRFVAHDAIDPMYIERAYFLLPAGEVHKAYRLLAATMEAGARAGVATFVMRGREVAIAIYAEHGILRAMTLRLPNEIRTPETIGLPAPPASHAPSAADAERVAQLRAAIHALAKPSIDTKALSDETAAAIRALAEKKRNRGLGVVEVPEALVTTGENEDGLAPIIDIATILKQRLGATTRPATRAPATKSTHAPTAKVRRATRPPRASHA